MARNLRGSLSGLVKKKRESRMTPPPPRQRGPRRSARQVPPSASRGRGRTRRKPSLSKLVRMKRASRSKGWDY